MRLKDVDGNEYLDFFGGILTVSVGHANDKVNAARRRADRRASGTSRRCIRRSRSSSSPRSWLAITPGRLQKSFFAASGTEADETAVMLAQVSHRSLRDHRAAPRLLGPLDARAVADRPLDLAPLPTQVPGHQARAGAVLLPLPAQADVPVLRRRSARRTSRS